MKKKKAIEILKFTQKWLAPQEEREKKEKLVDKTLNTFLSLKPIYKEYYQQEEIAVFVNMAYVLAKLRPVTEDMLLEFINGFSFLGFASSDERFNHYLFDSIFPAYKILNDFWQTDVFQKDLVKTEITGTGYQVIGDMRLPETRKDILFHIRRMGVIPLSPEQIQQVKRDLQKYNQETYSRKTEANVEIQTDTEKKESELTAKIERLNIELSKYGCWELEMTKELSDEQKEKFLTLLVINDLPYQIAMLEFIGFIGAFQRNYCKTKGESFDKLSSILNKSSRTIGGNIRSFNPHSNDRDKYSAYQHIDDVTRDFNSLKN